MSVAKICGRLTTKDSVRKGSDQPQILVTEDFSLSDCEYLSELAGLVVKGVGGTSPAKLQIDSAGVPCLVDQSLSVKDSVVVINNTSYNLGEMVELEFDSSENILKDESNILCFVNNVVQMESVRDKCRGIVIRSEELVNNNFLVKDGLLEFLRTDHDGALSRFYVGQRDDYIDIFTSLGSGDVVIRLLDSSLSELYPNEPSLQEKNVQLGNRGCRLLFTYPDIYVQQIKAILFAHKSFRDCINLKLAIPFVSDLDELKRGKKMVSELAAEMGVKVPDIGFTLETPRAVLLLPELDKESDFINLGFNDLTQLMFGFGRDDVDGFMTSYLEQGILEKDPFAWPDPVMWNWLKKELDVVGKEKPLYIPIHSQEHLEHWQSLVSDRTGVCFLAKPSLIK